MTFHLIYCYCCEILLNALLTEAILLVGVHLMCCRTQFSMIRLVFFVQSEAPIMLFVRTIYMNNRNKYHYQKILSSKKHDLHQFDIPL